MNIPSNTKAQAEQNQINNSTELTEEEVMRIADFGPSITDDEMKKMEAIAGSDGVGMQRRLCFAACARSADDISKLSLTEPEAFTEMFNAIECFKIHAEGLAEIAETALLRMQIADCRDEEVQAETNQQT